MTGWWFGFLFHSVGGISSSRLTKSISFSEGWLNHQPVYKIVVNSVCSGATVEAIKHGESDGIRRWWDVLMELGCLKRIEEVREEHGPTNMESTLVKQLWYIMIMIIWLLLWSWFLSVSFEPWIIIVFVWNILIVNWLTHIHQFKSTYTFLDLKWRFKIYIPSVSWG